MGSSHNREVAKSDCSCPSHKLNGEGKEQQAASPGQLLTYWSPWSKKWASNFATLLTLLSSRASGVRSRHKSLPQCLSTPGNRRIGAVPPTPDCNYTGFRKLNELGRQGCCELNICAALYLWVILSCENFPPLKLTFVHGLSSWTGEGWAVLTDGFAWRNFDSSKKSTAAF